MISNQGQRFKFLRMILALVLVLGQIYIPGAVTVDAQELAPVDLFTDKQLYQGPGDSVVMTVYDSTLDQGSSSVMVDVYEMVPTGEFIDPVDSNTYDLIYRTSPSLNESLDPGFFEETFTYADLTGDTDGVNEAILVINYNGIERMIQWTPLPMLETIQNESPVDVVHGFTSLDVEAIYIPEPNSVAVQVYGTSNLGTDDVTDDKDFILSLPKDFEAGQWADFFAPVTVDDYLDILPGSQNVIPVDPGLDNIIKLRYEIGNELAVVKTFTWMPGTGGGETPPDEGGGGSYFDLLTDNNIYQGINDSVAVTVYDDLAAAQFDSSTGSYSVTASVYNVEMLQGGNFDFSNPSTYNILSQTMIELLSPNQSGKYDGTLNFGETSSPGQIEVDDEFQNFIMLSYQGSGPDQQIDRSINWIPAESLTVEQEYRPVDTVLGLAQVTVRANYLEMPQDTTVPITINGLNDYGTIDTADDVPFTLSLDYESDPNAGPRQWADYKASVAFDVYDSGSNVIPINPEEMNNIALDYEGNEDFVISNYLTWQPAEFEFNEPLEGYVGMYSQDQSVPKIDLLNTGLVGSGSEQIAVEGVSETVYGSKSFTIVMFKEGPEQEEPDLGNYSRVIKLVDASSFTQEQDLNQNPDSVPVDPTMENTITFTYEQNGAVLLAEDSFIWTPDPNEAPPTGGGNEIWWGAYFPQSQNHSIDGVNPILDVIIDNFTGDASKLLIELWSDDESAQAPVASLSSAAEISTTETGAVYRFTPNGMEADILADFNLDKAFLQANLVYNDTVNSASTGLSGIMIDNQPPGDMGLDFRGIVETGEFLGMYHFRVYLGDEFGPQGSDSYNTLVSDGNFVHKRNGAVVQYVYDVVPFTDGMDSLYRDADLYLNEVQNGDTIEIRNLMDSVGHVMSNPVGKQVMLETEVSGTIYDSNSQILLNAKMTVVPYDEVEGLDLEGDIENIYTDDVGYFNYHLEAGTYKILSVEWNSQTGGPASAYLDQTLTVPPLANDQSYNFDITLPSTTNVSGQIINENNEPDRGMLLFINTAYLDQLPDGDMDSEKLNDLSALVMTRDDGSFSTYLPPGTYKLLGKVKSYSLVPPLSDVIVPVLTGAEVTVNATFPLENVFGAIMDASGSPVTNAEVIVLNQTTDEDFQMATTGPEGNFSFALNDGDYKLAGVMVAPIFEYEPNSTGTTAGSSNNDGFYVLDVTFSVSNGQVINVAGTNLTVDGSTLNDIELPLPNVTVQLTENGAPVTEEGMLTFFGEQLPDEIDIPGMGTYNFYLPAGTYTFTEAELFGSGYRSITLNETITITDMTDYTGTNALEFDLSGSANVVISFKDENGDPIGDGYGMDIEKVGSYERYWQQANSSGQIYLNLEPGQYKINGFDKGEDGNHSWQEYRQSFTVGLEHTSENKLAVDIIVKTPNIIGTVLDDNDTFIPWAWVDLVKTGGTVPQRMGFSTDDNGNFAISLDEGIYVVEGVGTKSEWIEMNFKFTVGTDPITDLVIKKPAANVTGRVLNAQGQPFATREVWTNGEPTEIWLNIREVVEDKALYEAAPWKYEKWVEVGADGYFSTTLEAGKTYEAYSISTPRKWIELDNSNGAYQFTVGVDSIDLEIAPPVPNFSGTVSFFNGTEASGGWLNIEKADGGWFGTEVGEDGSFGMNLAPGDYIIRDYSWEDGTDITKHNWMAFNKPVTVPSEGTINLMPNVKGIITTNLGDSQSDEYGVVIRQVLTQGDANYNDWQQNPWKYEAWFNATYDSNSGQAVFTGYLEDGKTYKLAAISGPNAWNELNEKFTLAGISSGSLVYDGAYDSYTLTLDASPNVTGVVTKGGSPIENAWLNIEKLNDGERAYFGTQTNTNGEFSLKLENGQYKITSYSTPGSWSNNKWQAGEWVNINYQFQVVDGALQDMDGNSLDTLSIGTNVNGMVQRFYKTGDGNNSNVIVPSNPTTESLVTLKHAWLTILPEENGEVNFNDWSQSIWANSNESGEFSLMLAPGTYRVTEAGGYDFWSKMDISFEVGSNGSLVANSNVIDGQLVIKPQLPNVKGLVKNADGNAVKRGWVSIKPASAAEDDWSSARWVDTDENGNFAMALSDGNWKIAEVSGSDTWFKVDLPFTVSGTTISSTRPNVIVGNELVVQPPTPNVVGIVNDIDGNRLNEMAWLTIKPADAGEHDWQDARWTEYNGTEFRMFLEPGDYRVVDVGYSNGWYRPDITFTVDDSYALTSDALSNGQLVVSPPAPNVMGIAYDIDNQIVPNAWLNVIRIDGSGNQLTMEGESMPIPEYENSDQDGIRWEYSRGVETDAQGAFSLRLDAAGTYKIIGVGSANVWYKPNQVFTVPAADLTVAPPQDNVTITVANTGLSDSEAWLDVARIKNGEKQFVHLELQSATNDNYTFGAYLEDGSYEITGFGTPTVWRELQESFQVNGITNYMVDFNAADKVSVTGTITGAPASEKVWVAILPVVNDSVDTSAEKRWIQSETSGSFSYVLRVGETWAVTDISTSQAYSENMNYQYTVTSEDNQQPMEWNIDLN